ncbi:MAG: hypothetical protein WAU75_15170 [Solirubrobacteraceae bacterium]
MAVFGGGAHGLVGGARWLKMVAADLGESAMQALSELVGRILVLRTTLSGDDDAGRGDPGETGEADELPAHVHQLRRVVA